MTDVTTLIDRHVALWNETDGARRRELLTQTFTEDASYQGPFLGSNGHDGIEALAREIQANLPGHVLRRISEIDAHHDWVRYSWEILPPNGEERFAAGTDVGVMGSDGRLRSVAVFLDQAPVRDGAHREE